MNCNLNDKIFFRLTRWGRELFATRQIAKRTSFRLFYISQADLERIYPIALPTDKDGYSELQLWEFMQFFGNDMYNGAKPVVEMQVQIMPS